MKMKLFNLHTHTNYCDGKEAPGKYVQKAIELGFQSLGFSGHAPLPFENDFSIPESELHFYAMDIRDLQEKYKDQIEIYLGLEFDYIPEVLDDFSLIADQIDLDFVIGSVHLVRNPDTGVLWFTDGPKRETYDEGLKTIFGGDIRKAVTAFYHQSMQMIESQAPDIIGHLDKIKMHNQNRFFKEDEAWYIKLVDETLELAKSNDCIVEVNTRGIYKKRCESFFPGVEILKKMKDLKIPVTVSSDAHTPSDLSTLLPEAIEQLKAIGYGEVMTLKKGVWTSQGI